MQEGGRRFPLSKCRESLPNQSQPCPCGVSYPLLSPDGRAQGTAEAAQLTRTRILPKSAVCSTLGIEEKARLVTSAASVSRSWPPTASSGLNSSSREESCSNGCTWA